MMESEGSQAVFQEIFDSTTSDFDHSRQEKWREISVTQAKRSQQLPEFMPIVCLLEVRDTYVSFMQEAPHVGCA